MKLKISSIFLLVAVIAFSAFKNFSKSVTYAIDTQKSSIAWKGTKAVGSSQNGTIALKSGALDVDGQKITGGNFVIDMRSIKDANGSETLENHLKADDFFGTAKYETANFVITKSTGSGANLTITGNLTIKGITNPITFPATLAVAGDGTVTATAAKILVDRTKYDIKYGSKSFFGSIGDKAINNEFELSVKLVGKK